MTPLAVVASAIVLNVGVLVGGVVWLRRQMTRVAAEREARGRVRPAKGEHASRE